MKETKPNIFKIATNELSQDGFFTWLLQWADNEHNQHDAQLNETAKDFVRMLLRKERDFQINKVTAGRQLKNIDIWAEINNEYFIVIEDKTNTGYHSGQLERYKDIATNHPKYKDHKPVFIYLKTGNESAFTLNKISKKNYELVDRKSILSVLNIRPIENEIFNDFKDYLSIIEEATNDIHKIEQIKKNGYTTQGFYLKLEELLGSDANPAWKYVPNASGGFWGFWYHFARTLKYHLYIQIEISNHSMRLVVKIGDWDPNIYMLRHISDAIKPYAKKYDLEVIKPEKLSAGQNSTVVTVVNPYVEVGGKLDINSFITTLKKLEKALDDYSTETKVKQESEIKTGQNSPAAR